MRKQIGVILSLIFYDILIFAVIDILLFVLYRGAGSLDVQGIVEQSAIAFVSIFVCRYAGKIYSQIWRYGGIQCYIRLLVTDSIAFVIYLIAEFCLPVEKTMFAKILAFCCMNTLGALAIRLTYRYAYKCGSQDNKLGAFLRWSLKFFSGGRVKTEADSDYSKIKVAIIGAGTVGVELAENLINNKKAQYVPRCFIDNRADKVGRNIHDLEVLSENEATLERLRTHHVQEVIFAVPRMDSVRKFELYDYYQKAGFQIKVFDYPFMDTPGAKRQLRDFDIEDLLMRKPKEIITDKTREYYKDKVILITGGGGSIGSELCRQLAKMEPKQLVVLDIYENCAYDLQQSILFSYNGKVDIKVVIASIRDKKALARCFKKYHPDICINAAAHKHVPLMEANCVEAVENNVFGCLNVIQCCEEFGCGRFMMVSTDKAVNPTNIMGASKRVCEMIMQAYSTRGKVKCSATRFGNVLGSAGSVIPLFKRQIAAGGPVTVTDKRIIRYFMTIPEASQLVLTSGAMAENGDLFVLDMGKPVKIWDLAENMIRLSGRQDIEIMEIGLRPGEKLYEELLVKTEELEKTDHDMIFIEHEEAVSMEQIEEKMERLRLACDRESDLEVREAIRTVVPTFRNPEEINKDAIKHINRLSKNETGQIDSDDVVGGMAVLPAGLKVASCAADYR